MHERINARRWLFAILIAGVLVATPLLALASETPIRIAPGGAAGLTVSQAGNEEAQSPPTFQHVTYARSVAWWPYTKGPWYGTTPGAERRADDVIVTPVGRFRVGESLDIPAELTATLDRLANGQRQYFVVQLKPAALDQPDWRDSLTSMGAEIVASIPVNAVIMRLDRAAYDMVSGSPLVQFIEPWHPAYRIDPSVGRMPQATPEAAASPIFQLKINLFPGEPAGPVAEALKKMGAEVLSVSDHDVVVRAHASLVTKIAHIEPVWSITELGPQFLLGDRGALYLQSERALLGDYPYWKARLDGDGQIVHVTDSGMSVDAGDFADTRTDSGWDSGSSNRVPSDHRKVVAYKKASEVTGGGGDLSACDSGVSGASTHGQVCAGIAVGNGTRGKVPVEGTPSPTDDPDDPNKTWVRDFGQGFWEDDPQGTAGQFDLVDTTFDGIGKGAKLLFLDASSGCPDGQGISGGSWYQNIAKTWTDYRANIHSFSYGSDANENTGPVYNTGANDIDDAIWDYPVNFVAIAAGNAGNYDDSPNDDGTNISNLGNEASCKNCVCVGASSGVGGTMFSFTSHGPATQDSHRVAPLIFAQGWDNACRSEDEGVEDQTGPATCYSQDMQGTSQATPQLAGAAAVIREYFAEGFYPDGSDQNSSNENDKVETISGMLVKALMIVGTKPITGGKTLVPEYRFNHLAGYGQFFLTRALPLVDYPDSTVSGLIVHDRPGDIDGDGNDDGVSHLSLADTIATGSFETSAEFQVLDEEGDDLAVALVWNDPSSSDALVDDIDLEVRYCGDDGTCGNSDDTVFFGNFFQEDINRNGAVDTGEDLDSDGTQDEYFYSMDATNVSDSFRDDTNNTEAVFVPTKYNAPDKDADGTWDVPVLKAGTWQVKVIRRSGTDVLKYALAIAGPVAAGSSVRFDQNPVTCNGEVKVMVDEVDDAGDPDCPDADHCPASVIGNRVTVQVLDEDGTVVDTETGITFDRPTDALHFVSHDPLPLTTELDAPADNDGMLSVGNNYTLKVFYDDKTDNGATDVQRVSTAKVDCQPDLGVALIRQLGPDYAFYLDGGCDDDKYLDQGETFALTLQYYNLDGFDLADALLGLKAVVPDGDDDTDPCRENNAPVSWIDIENPEISIGMLPSQTTQRSTFTFSVSGTPPQRDRIELVVSLRGTKAGQQVADCQAFEFLGQADDEVHFYTTDCPTGCTLDYDRNYDEKWEDKIAPNDFDPLDFIHRGLQEADVVYEDMTNDAYGYGNPGFNGPWDFDQDDEGFRVGVSPMSENAASNPNEITNWGEDMNWDGVLQPEEDRDDNGTTGVLDENWGTGGGCGWMTKASSASRGGIWHTGTIKSPADPNNGGHQCVGDESFCEPYDTAYGTEGKGFWFEGLRTPVIHPVHWDPDGTAGWNDGYAWRTWILDWSWNYQYDVKDDNGNAAFSWEFDLDVDSYSPVHLGDEWIHGGLFGNKLGLRGGGQLSIYGGGFAFQPTDTDPNSSTYGDGTNGTIGGNRAGVRGCYFNDLDDIDTGDGLTGAERPVRTAMPKDDDCDNDYTLGPDGCPGTCGVDDDGDGAIDEPDEICPCRVCESGSPRAGQWCLTAAQCNVSSSTSYQCVSNTDANGKPQGHGDDVCGDGQTDENVAADFGTNRSIRQDRNADMSMVNGIARGGRGGGNPYYNTLEDFYGPVGPGWQAEIGFIVFEGTGEYPDTTGYGAAVDDMVIEWRESHPVGQAGDKCSTSSSDFEGQCASVALGVSYNTHSGDGAVPVTVIDWNASTTENAVDCDGDGTMEVEVYAFSEAERIPETFCLDPVAPGSDEYRGEIQYTTRVKKQGDGLVYLAFNGLDTPSINVRYYDKNDGVHGWDTGADGQPGIAGFDDDGDGTVDNPEELCPTETNLAPGRTPHLPGQEARYSDDNCGCIDNPLTDATFAAFDVADVMVAKAKVWDGIDGHGTGDGDGWADPGEEVLVSLYVRNMSDFEMEDIVLTVTTDSDNVECLTDDTIVIPRLAKHGEDGDEVDTSTLDDGFVGFVAARVTRQSTGEDLSSLFNVSMRAMAVVTPDSEDLPDVRRQNVPIAGTAIAQTFRVVHNLDASGFSDTTWTEDFESYASDQDLFSNHSDRRGWERHNTGDDASELDGTHCQYNDPNNPYGNNTDPEDYCELGEGYDNSENHWHLHTSKHPPSGQTVCEMVGCPDGRSMAGGVSSLHLGNHVEADGSLIDDNTTLDMNRMRWAETRYSIQLGTGNPELSYWTQLSITDWRLFSGGYPPWDFDAALTYICVDKNGNDDCDTLETGNQDGSEKWEPLHAWFSPETSFRMSNFINCMYDPSDDGNTEDDFFPNSMRTGPSSTCFPYSSDSCVGRTRQDDPWGQVSVTLWSGCFPETGEESEGSAGNNAVAQTRWIQKKYDLTPWKGQKVLIRFHVSPGGLPGIENCASIIGPFCSNRDDGWWIDNIQITGASSGGTLSVDNDGESPSAECPSSNCGSVNAALAAVPYPRVDKNLNRKPAIACSDQTVDYCDFDGDGNVDVNSDTGDANAPGRPFWLDGSKSDADACLGGALEYRFETSDGAVVRDWQTNPYTVVTPKYDTTYVLKVRCSSATSCIGEDEVTIKTPLGGGQPDECWTDNLRFPAGTKTTFEWDPDANAACPSVFDTAKGDLDSLRSSGNFSGASCLENDGTDTQSTDSATPAAGDGYWYLTRVNGYSYNTQAGSQSGNRDASLDACP